MTHTENHSEDVVTSQEAFEQLVKERLQYAVRIALKSRVGGRSDRLHWSQAL